MGTLILHAGKEEEEQKVEEGLQRCLCVRFLEVVFVLQSLNIQYFSAYVSVWFCVLDDVMSICVRKGGSPGYLRARPECHR